MWDAVQWEVQPNEYITAEVNVWDCLKLKYCLYFLLFHICQKGCCVTNINLLVTRNKYTHTQPFNGRLSGSTRLSRYQKKHSPTQTHPHHQTSFINFLHLLRSTASSLLNVRAWQSFSETSFQVLFGLHLGLGPCFILHTFLHPIIIFFSQRMPISSQPVLL